MGGGKWYPSTRTQIMVEESYHIWLMPSKKLELLCLTVVQYLNQQTVNKLRKNYTS
uniref:Uncharacterized protein n=1 Tax=Arundo donax TaxID=35708 RepID=A0A0A9A504_ARUDO